MPARLGEDYFSEYSSSAFYAATDREIAALERSLPDRLREARAPQGPIIAGKLARYRRQVVGVVVDGKRRVAANYFCTRDPVDKVLMVLDGGDCYFEVLFDPATTKLVELHIHGDG